MKNGLLVVSCLLATTCVAADRTKATKHAVTDATVPVAADVAGTLNLPYSGPGWVQITDDGYLILDVGGNIGATALSIDGYDGTEVNLLGLLQIEYENGILDVSVDDGYESFYRSFNVAFRSEDYIHELAAPDHGIPCPANKKCCSCTSEGGGSATAVCNEDEKPRCNCRPCCSSTCAKMNKSVVIR